MWIKYNSRSGTHNMYREYRDTNLNSAIDTLCKYTSIELLANDCLNIFLTAQKDECRNKYILVLIVINSFSHGITVINLFSRQRHGWSPQIQKQEHPDHPYRHRGCQRLQESHHHTIPRKSNILFL